jgi:hypothetical protein
MVKAQLMDASSDVRLRISTDSLFTTYTDTAPAATGGNHVATFPLSGLAPSTRYHYRVVVGGTEDTSKQGAFRTLPIAGRPQSFTFAIGSCQATGSNTPIFGHIQATNPLFWLQAGDIHYRDIAVDDINAFREAYNDLHVQSWQAALFRSTAIVHMWDDHDGAGGNDTDGTRPGWPAVRAAYRESVPHHVLPAGPGGAIYHSFVVGRVRFIVSDLRSERSPKSQTDNASKTMMGATQKQWFKDELAAAVATQQFVAWVSTIPWIAARRAGDDSWAGYDTERQEIAAYIQSLGIAGQMFVLTGDMHATAIDSGVNNSWGGFPLFNAGPVNATTYSKGGPYTHGPFLGGSWEEQFGTVAVTDNGGSSIEVVFSGRRGGSEIPGAFHRFTLRLATPPREVASLEDDFNANERDGDKWSQTFIDGGNFTQLLPQNQRLEIHFGQNRTGSNYTFWQSAPHHLTNSQVHLQVVQNSNNSLARTIVGLHRPQGSDQIFDYLRWRIDGGSPGRILAQVRASGGTLVTLGDWAFDANARWLRIRHSAAENRVYWESAPDEAGRPGTWTVRHAWQPTINLNGFMVLLGGGTSGSVAASAAFVDNFNHVP